MIDAYLQIGGIKRESTDQKHKDLDRGIERSTRDPSAQSPRRSCAGRRQQGRYLLQFPYRGALRMKLTFISLGVAFLVVAVTYISIFFYDPGMNVEKAFNIIVLSFIGSAVLTALVLGLRGRRR